MSYVAVLKIEYDAFVAAHALSLCARSVRAFKGRPGLIDIKAIRAVAKPEIMIIMVWESEPRYRTATERPEWRSASDAWSDLFQQEVVRLELTAYDDVDVSPPGA